MKTMASTFRSSPPVISPALHPRREREERLDLVAASSPPARESRAWSREHLLEPGRGGDRPRRSENESGGSSRRTCGSEAVPVRIRRPKSARCTSSGRAVEVQTEQEPAAADTRKRRAPRAPRARWSPTRTAFVDAAPRARSHRVLASAAAQGTGPPPKVLPRSPIVRRAVMAGVATTAPIGSPAARPLANVRMSGVTPNASAALNAPHRPTPHCTSSKMRAAPRSSQMSARGLRETPAEQSRAPASPCTGSTMQRGDRVVDRGVERGDVVERRPCGRAGCRRAGRRPRSAAPSVTGERGRGASVPAAGAPRRSSAGRCASAPDAARSRSPPRPSCRRTPGPADRDRATPACSASCFAQLERHRGRVEQQLLGLLGDGAHDVGMAVPGGGDGVAAVGVEPLLAVLVHQPRAVAADRTDRKRRRRREAARSPRAPRLTACVACRASARIDRSSTQSGGFLQPEREVHRLDRLPAGALHQVVDRDGDLHLRAVGRRRRRGSARSWSRRRGSARAARPSTRTNGRPA